MSSAGWFTALVLLVAVERVAELVVSRRNLAWSTARGGIEHGSGHYPAMTVLHGGLLAGAVVEVVVADRPFLPVLGWTAVGFVLAAQALRWWCIGTLGRQWNTRIVVVPSLGRVRRGPYRVLAHPNYVAVVAEGIALPLTHSAWVTAIVFTALNAILLTVRIRAESAALAGLSDVPGAAGR
ncbi:MAG: isoprenylcysteine carboxyl methyltransferase family protein [Angustibacter sp.]